MTACVSVSDGCRPPVFGNDEGSVIDDVKIPEKQTQCVCTDTRVDLSVGVRTLIDIMQ